METRHLPQKNNRQFVPGLTLWVLCIFSLACCHPASPPQATLLSSTTYTELESARPVRVPLQLPAHAVLLEMRGHNVNFRSSLVESNGHVSSDIHLAFLRSAPIYHLIDAALPQQTYTLELTPVQTNRLASVTINIFVLPTGSTADAALATAWRNLAQGLQLVASETAADWAGNLAALNTARQAFEQLGLAEPALWAGYFSAYFQYYPLYRYAEALEATSSLIATADELGLPELTLLGHQLAGQILIERDAGEDKAQARQVLQLAQQHFTLARQRAEAANNSFETTWALNNAGITFNYADKMSAALDTYAQALALAIDLQDPYLINLIRSNMVVPQEKLGRIDEAIETLLHLQREPQVRDDPLEMEHLLSLLGLYYPKLYRFPQALDVLNQALALSLEHDWAENRGRDRLLLGQVYREMGQPDKSLAHLQMAIPDLETARDGRGMRRALSLSADISRLNQRFDEMAGERARQEHYLATDSDRADWLWSSARDAVAEADFKRAIMLYQQSAEAYATSSFGPLAQLARLNACVLEVRLHAEPSCSTTQLQSGYDSIQSMQASTSALEGKFLWAQLQALEGQRESAEALIASLVEEIGFYRQSLPGILGAWYWDARRQIFDFYMELVLDSSTAPEQTALESLLALNQMRNTYLYQVPTDSARSLQSVEHPSGEAIRTLMAQRDQARNPQALAAAQRDIDQLLLSGADHAEAETKRLTAVKLQQQLHDLPADWSVLTFYITERNAWVWAGNKQGLKRLDLGHGREIRDLIDRTKANIRTVNHSSLNAELAQLGERLLAPVKRELRAKVLFMGAGALSDFPLEALVLDGQPLIRHYQVVNIMSADDLHWLVENLGHSLKPDSLFLAGNPASPSQNLPELRGAASELAAVRNYFPDAVTTRYEGPDLVRSIFATDSFSTADLVHIASHATIDREYPELSRLMLSGSSEQASEFLTPNDLQYRQISAQLVVLSACSTVGLNRFDYDNNLGFVSRFLQQGSGFVIASLWPIPDRATAQFLTGFYQQLAAGTDVAGALRNTKLSLQDSGPSGSAQWASFQLFSR